MADFPKALLKTNFGDITVELNSEKAPVSSQNFIDYANEGQYNGTIFHRVIEGFMIQGGGFDASMTQKKTKAPIKNEATNKLTNDRGTIAMARTQVVDSATCQFFINLVDNDFLNHKAKTPAGYGYAVFGKVVEGMDVVDKIAAVATGNKGGHADVPTQDVIIESVTIAN